MWNQTFLFTFFLYVNSLFFVFGQIIIKKQFSLWSLTTTMNIHIETKKNAQNSFRFKILVRRALFVTYSLSKSLKLFPCRISLILLVQSNFHIEISKAKKIKFFLFIPHYHKRVKSKQKKLLLIFLPGYFNK